MTQGPNQHFRDTSAHWGIPQDYISGQVPEYVAGSLLTMQTRNMTIPPSIPDPAAALRSALKNFDPFVSTRDVLRNFDSTAAIRAATASYDPYAASRAALRNLDGTAAVNTAIQNFSVTASVQAALRTIDPSAALNRALASVAPAEIGRVKLRTMPFQTGVDLLSMLKRMSLTTVQVPALQVPGFDAAVRDAVTSAATAIGASIDLPEGEIEYVAIPDPEISLSPEFGEITAPAVERHRTSEWPQTAGKAINWIAYVILILSVTQEAAPTIHEHDPTGITNVVAEHWPEQAQLPDWFVDLYLLAYAIKSERPRSTKGPDSD